MEFLKQQKTDESGLADPTESSRALTLTLGADGNLKARLPNGVTARVTVCPCFPWSNSSQFFVLKDGKNEEVYLLENPNELDRASRLAFEQALKETRFVFTVTDVFHIREDFELRVWDVLTEQGKRQFQTKLGEWPRATADGGYLIQDISGDLYAIPNLEGLPASAQRKLWPYLDQDS